MPKYKLQQVYKIIDYMDKKALTSSSKRYRKIKISKHFNMFEGYLSSTAGNEVLDTTAESAITTFFLLLQAEVYDGYREGFPNYKVNYEVLYEAHKEIDKIGDNISEYPWGLMVKGLCFLVERDEEKANTYIENATAKGLDNILVYIAKYIITIRQRDRLGLTQALKNIIWKEGEASTLAAELNRSRYLSYGTLDFMMHNCIRLYSDYYKLRIHPSYNAINTPDNIYDGYLDDGKNTYKIGVFWNRRIQEPLDETPAFYALEAFHIISERNPNYQYLPLDMKTPAALGNLKQALEINEDYAWAHFIRAIVNFENNENAKALDEIEKTIKLGLSNSIILSFKARVNSKLGKYKESLETLKLASESAGNLRSLASIYHLRNTILARLGNKIFYILKSDSVKLNHE